MIGMCAGYCHTYTFCVLGTYLQHILLVKEKQKLQEVDLKK